MFQSGAEGYVVSEQSGHLAALSTELNEELVQEGLAREIVRRIQQLRKDMNLEVSDRIEAYLDVSDNLKQAINTYQDYICEETLADSIVLGGVEMEQTISDDFDGETFKAGLKVV